MQNYFGKLFATGPPRRAAPGESQGELAQARDRLLQRLRDTAPHSEMDGQAAQAFWLDLFASEPRRSGLGLTAAQRERLDAGLQRGLLPAARMHAARQVACPHPLTEMPRSLPDGDALLADGYRLVEHTLGDAELPYDLRLMVADAASSELHVFLTSCDRLGNASNFFAGLLQWPRPGRDCMLDPARFEAAALTQLLASLHGVAASVAYDTCVELASLIDYLGPTRSCAWHDLVRQCRTCFLAKPVSDDELGAVLLRLAEAGPAVAPWAQWLVAQVAGLSAAERLRLPLQAVRLVVDEHPTRWHPENCLRWVRDYAAHHKAASQSVAQYLRQTELVHSPAWAELPPATLRQPSIQALFDDNSYGRLARRRDREVLPAATERLAVHTNGIYSNTHNRSMGCRARIDHFVAWFGNDAGPAQLETLINWCDRAWKLRVSKTGISLCKQDGQNFLASMWIVLRDHGGADGDGTLGFAPLDFLPGQEIGLCFF